MAQGQKLKKGAKLPLAKKSKKQKGNAVTKRSNCPIKPKKKQHEEAQKIKQIVNKTVNKTIEEEMRSRVAQGKKKLSKVQEITANSAAHYKTKSCNK